MLDCLVASGVAAIALVATAATVLSAQRETQRITQVRAATPILASLLEEVRGAPFSTVVTNYAGATRAVTGMPMAGGGATATFTVTDVATGSTRWLVRRVDVLVRWNGPGGTGQVAGVTFVSDRSSGTSGVGGGS
jgi:hypothetical protein